MNLLLATCYRYKLLSKPHPWLNSYPSGEISLSYNWTLMVDCYNLSILMCVLGAQKNHLIEIEKSLKIKCLEMC